jgi:3',5'-cyclic AMP phosphodiesterase CpdA
VKAAPALLSLALTTAVLGVAALGVAALGGACATVPAEAARGAARPAFPAYPDAKFIVFSDPHLYDPAAFVASGEQPADRAQRLSGLAGPSAEILDSGLEAMSHIAADFVLVAGDLTQDGEEADHLAMARRLEALRAGGKKVYVIPGNHDVEDGDARSFLHGARLAVPGVGPEEFAKIYEDFGYGEARSRAPDSLSYEAEPLPGLVLLALDDNRWKENLDGRQPIRGGRLSQATLAWLRSRLGAAAESGMAVIVMQHHEVLEHMKFSAVGVRGTLVDGASALASLYARTGARLVFSGHFHSQDAAVQRRPDGFVCDVATGSFIEYPCPFRVVVLEGGRASFETRLVESIPSRPSRFQAGALEATFAFVRAQAELDLAHAGVPSFLARVLAGNFAEDYLEHYPGAAERAQDKLWSQERPLDPFALDLSRGLLSD